MFGKGAIGRHDTQQNDTWYNNTQYDSKNVYTKFVGIVKMLNLALDELTVAKNVSVKLSLSDFYFS